MNVIDKITEKQMKKDVPDFRVGDLVKVNAKITEGKRQRIQIFEGLVIGRRGTGLTENFTVRKTSYGVGVERVFPVHSPMVESIEIVKKGKARRAKLNYVRNIVGQYRIKERGNK